MSPALRRAVPAALMLLACGTARAAGAQPLNCSGQNAVTQSFGPPATATGWGVCWYDDGVEGLVITEAWFRAAPGAPWRRVLGEMRHAEIFVPYHDGDVYKRFYDLTGGFLNRLTAQDCPAAEGGTLLSQPRPPLPPWTPPDPPPQVCRELRRRGVAWREYDRVRRGQELVLWGSYDPGGYKFIMEYAFRDDGVVTARMGSTGVNHGSWPALSHMHDVMFRVDLDLNGPGLDRAKLLTHTEMGWAAADAEQPITVEAGLKWDDEAFTGLLIEDAALTNAHGHASGYMLVPIRTGTARHAESWTQYDFWLTRADANERSADLLPTYITTPGAANVPESLAPSADIVAWYWGSAHHHPRDEDGSVVGSSFQGVTQVMWTGVMLIPHNWFDAPPHWEPPPPPCGPPFWAC